MDMDERISSWGDIQDFFVGDHNTRGEVLRVIEDMQEEFFNDAVEAFDEQMLDDQIALAKEEAKSDGLSDEEIDELFSEAEGTTYEKYMDNAKEELEQTFFDDFFEGWIRKNYPYMSKVTESFGLVWPHWTYGGGTGEAGVDDVAQEIQDAIGMRVKGSSGYHSAKRGSDYFILEPDSSIDADERDGEAGLELVSPPMPLNDCLDYLDKVFKWANDYGCRTDRSTGFHMGISIPDQTMENVDHLKFTLFLGDEYVLRQFGRESNTYAKSMIKEMGQNIKRMGDANEAQKMLDTFKQGMNSVAANIMKNLIKSSNDRYVTVNIKKNYIEVRSAGGDYLDSLDKIKLTLLRYVRAMGLAADPEAERQEYAKKLYKFLSPLVQGDEDVIKYFSQYSAGTLPATALKSFVKNVQQKRSAKKIPDIINVNAPKKGTYAFLVKYMIAGNIRKALRVYSSGRSDAMKKAEDFLDLKKISGAIYHIEADINDPTNQTSTSSGSASGNFLIRYLGDGNTEMTANVPANSQADAVTSFRRSNPRAYILDVQQNTGTTSEAGTYIIQYQSPNRFAADQTAIDANSQAEAITWFRSNHPSTYRIISVQLQR